MELQIIDRINILSMLPQQGTFSEMIHIDSINKLVNISSDEATEINLTTEGEQIRWDATKEKPLTVKFNKEQKKVLDSIFDKIQEADSVVDMNVINLYNKLKT